MRTPAIIGATALFCALAFLLIARSTGNPSLETQTFALEYMHPQVAENAILPYVYTDRPNASGVVSTTDNLITVRETRDNLERIARVLEEYDVPPYNVHLHFQLIAANGSSTTDESIADVESVLRRLFRFEGYSLMGEAMLSGLEGSSIGQVVGNDLASEAGRTYGTTGETPYFELEAYIANIRGDSDSGTASLHVSLGSAGAGNIIETSVNVRVGQTVVLGSAQPLPGSRTVILTVRPEIVRP